MSASLEPDDDADDEAFRRFYLGRFSKLVTFLVGRGIRVHDAADCVQETMIEIRPPKWSSIEHPYTWCRTTSYRKSLRIPNIMELPTADLDRAGSVLITQERGIEIVEEHLEFFALLSKLSAIEREVLVWTYDGAKPAEIAVALNMKPVNVRSTLRNARAKIRSLRGETP